MRYIYYERENFDNRTNSPTTFLNFDTQIDLSSTEDTSMARLLVQQQTPNINIHQTTATQDEALLPISHSVDDRIFYMRPDSNSFLKLVLQRFASEPQISTFSSTSNGFLANLNNNSLSLSNTFLPLNKSDEEEEKHEENFFNIDQIQPIITEDIKSHELDTISKATILDDLNEDILFNTNTSSTNDRPSRRRKRRSSLTKTPSITDGQSQSIATDTIEKIDDNNNDTTTTNTEEDKSANVQALSLENLSLEDNNQEKQESIETNTTNNRLRGRKLRYRSYRAPQSQQQQQQQSTSQEPVSDESIQFSLSTEQTTFTAPPSSPISSPTDLPSLSTSPNSSNGKLKRTGSIGTTKKMVRFADSVGRQLAQVQYIQSLIDGDDDDDYLDMDSKEFSFIKNNIYLPEKLNIAHKPWSFDVQIPSKQFYSNPTPIRKRFFCLYRQPISEHPDIYLHETWKSQIKLEHADIRLKSSTTGEQYLYGTLWVTNASYWKYVSIKYTFNRWLNTYEYEAHHRCHSNDFRNIDQFEFSIDIPYDVDRIDFVLRYCVNGQEYWDNNDGKNYTLETESLSTPKMTISLPHDCDFNEMRFY